MYADNWALRAKEKGYRSRAVFKLEEIFAKFSIPKKLTVVLDLGAAPGGWSQYVKEYAENPKVFAIDLLNMKPINGVKFFQTDIQDLEMIGPIMQNKGHTSLVISDLAPNLSGIVAVDVANIFELNMMTLKTASDFLEKSGILIVKTFQNENLKIFKKEMENVFKIVQTHKPAASKKQSQEIYLIGQKLHE
tara:strand:+ start:3019 stop:3591 length:573 start_codon:yes stop_codon:yes gene_type:complete